MTPVSWRRLFSLEFLRSFTKFGIVGASGVAVNEGLLLLIQSMGVYFLYAGAIAIEISIVSNFVMNDLWTFRDRRTGRFAVRLLKFNLLMIVGLAVNLAVLDFGTVYLGMSAALANLAGIVVAFVLRYALSVKYAWMRIEAVEEGGAVPAAGPISDLSGGSG